MRTGNETGNFNQIFDNYQPDCYTFLGSPPRGGSLDARLWTTSFFLPGDPDGIFEFQSI